MTGPEQTQDSSVQLSPAAEKALRRATGRTLTSFARLRKALREHVENERNNHSLAEIEMELRALVARVRLECPVSPADAGSQDNLSDHVMEWSDTFFRAPRTRTQSAASDISAQP